MVEISLEKTIHVNEYKNLCVHYILFSHGASYDIECCVENSAHKSWADDCIVKSFTNDRKTAIDFTKKMAESEVTPIHLTEITDDFFEL